MCSNLTEAEKSQRRGKGKGTSEEEGAGRKEKINGKEEKRVEEAGIDKKPWQHKAIQPLRTLGNLYAKLDARFHKVTIIFSHSSPQKVLNFCISI